MCAPKVVRYRQDGCGVGRWGDVTSLAGGSNMFGKKKPVSAEVRDFHCGLCGIDCADDDRLSRHVNWAHPGSVSVRTEKKEPAAVSGKKG